MTCLRISFSSHVTCYVLHLILKQLEYYNGMSFKTFEIFQIFLSPLSNNHQHTSFPWFSRCQDKVRANSGHFVLTRGHPAYVGETESHPPDLFSSHVLTSKYFQETFKTFHTPSVDASNAFFDEHFNKYHPILPQRMENNVHQDEGYHYSKPVDHYKKPVVDHQPYSVSNFEPEFFKQFYDETEKHFLPVRTNTNHALRKSTILKNKEPKKFAFPTFETF